MEFSNDIQAVTSQDTEDIYHMLHINCKYRRGIHAMIKDAMVLKDKRMELEDRWADFANELNEGEEQIE